MRTQRVFDTIAPAKDVDGFDADQRRVDGAESAGARRVHAVGRDRAARARADPDRRPARRRHRAQRDRREADGIAAPAPGRDRHHRHSKTPDLAEVSRRADILIAAVGRPGLVTQGLRQAGSDRDRRRHEPRDRRGRRAAPVSARVTRGLPVPRERAPSSWATSTPRSQRSPAP